MEVQLYDGNLNVEELLDWITALHKYFIDEDVGMIRRSNMY